MMRVNSYQCAAHHRSLTDVLEACKKYGSADRNLWVQALEYFAGRRFAARGAVLAIVHLYSPMR